MEIGKGEVEFCCGGYCLESGDLVWGYFFVLMVFDYVVVDVCIVIEEIFGLVFLVICVCLFEEVIVVVNGVCYGFIGLVFICDIFWVFVVIEKFDIGMNYVNNFIIGGEVYLFFGGIKYIGIGFCEMGFGVCKGNLY